MSTTLKNKSKFCKTENKIKRRNRNRIGSLDEFKNKVYVNKQKIKTSRPKIKVSKGRKAPGRLSKAASSVSLFGTQSSSQGDSNIKTLKKPRSRLNLKSDLRKSAFNLEKYSSTHDLRLSNLSDIKDYLTLTKVSTPLKNPPPKTPSHPTHPQKPSNYTVTHPCFPNPSPVPLQNPQISQNAQNIKNIQNVKIPGRIDTLRIPSHFRESSNETYKGSFNDNCMMKVSNVDGSQERTIVDFINNKSEEVHGGDVSNQMMSSFEPSVADEVEYDPREDPSQKNCSLNSTDLQINEGSNEYNRNLIKQIQPYNFDSVTHKSGKKKSIRFKSQSQSCDKRVFKNRSASRSVGSKVKQSPIPSVIQSTINLRAYRKYEGGNSDQQGFFLPSNSIYSKTLSKSNSTTANSARTITSARTRTFINKFNC